MSRSRTASPGQVAGERPTGRLAPVEWLLWLGFLLVLGIGVATVVWPELRGEPATGRGDGNPNAQAPGVQAPDDPSMDDLPASGRAVTD